ncbi:DUF971 domain-containing protein [Leptospira terpstrae]|uniref:PF06155 family protein n=1 Tax=Leptospira terpstrae serovar Hualin str. LT 11-33 = ATCC 700639 TaxID=1257025 RepID=N1VYM5_9LEPT|nr:DUF971 domain-containing protein [Leptospira terpstrae]EMY60526.1 PF06155 family protein [Leptospira terpstrae serovar Hualin str. LT 11-33 = ATCC 700639]
MPNSQLATFPKDISFDDDSLYIEWKDGHGSKYSLLDLRKKCPCATCRGGHGGSVGQATGHIESIKLLSWTKVGRYAISIVWSDYHNTGIYSYDNLRAYSDGLASAFD